MKTTRKPTAIEIVAQAWQRQYDAKVRIMSEPTAEKLAVVRRITCACLRASEELDAITPMPGTFTYDGWTITRRRVDDVDNIYAQRI